MEGETSYEHTNTDNISENKHSLRYKHSVEDADDQLTPKIHNC